MSIARAAGVCWLMTIVAGICAVVLDDPAAATANLVATGFYVGATILVYLILKPVDKILSLLAACFSLVGCTLSVLRPAGILDLPFNPLVFFGLHCLLVGYLFFTSRLVPRFVGLLLAFGGLGWLTFVAPPLAKALAPYNMLPGILGEGVLSVWLIVAGVRKSAHP